MAQAAVWRCTGSRSMSAIPPASGATRRYTSVLRGGARVYVCARAPPCPSGLHARTRAISPMQLEHEGERLEHARSAGSMSGTPDSFT